MTAPTSGNFLAINTVLLTSNSTGSVKLATASAWDYPIIDANFLSTDYDKYVLSEGLYLFIESYRLYAGCSELTRFIPAIAVARRIATAQPMNGYIMGEYGALASATTATEITSYIESRVVPNWQYVFHTCFALTVCFFPDS